MDVGPESPGLLRRPLAIAYEPRRAGDVHVMSREVAAKLGQPRRYPTAGFGARAAGQRPDEAKAWVGRLELDEAITVDDVVLRPR